jgi:hypothetical protein
MTAESLKRKIRLLLFFGFGILITYGLWPARNIFLQHKFIFTQSTDGIGHVWSIDFLSFINFSNSVSTDFIPVYKEIIQDKKVVDWPKQAYLDRQDSVLLDSAVQLCRTCGTGFSFWQVFEGLREQPVRPSENCDTVIHNIFTSLYLKQKSRNIFNYWITVPLGNLRKCFFKLNLYENKSEWVKLISSSLFILRSISILMGLLGLFLAWRNRFLSLRFLFLAFCFMIGWYFYLSFYLRNIEIRYLLQCDILLLIPAAYLITQLLFNKRQTASLRV